MAKDLLDAFQDLKDEYERLCAVPWRPDEFVPETNEIVLTRDSLDGRRFARQEKVFRQWLADWLNVLGAQHKEICLALNDEIELDDERFARLFKILHALIANVKASDAPRVHASLIKPISITRRFRIPPRTSKFVGVRQRKNISKPTKKRTIGKSIPTPKKMNRPKQVPDDYLRTSSRKIETKFSIPHTSFLDHYRDQQIEGRPAVIIIKKQTWIHPRLPEILQNLI